MPHKCFRNASACALGTCLLVATWLAWGQEDTRQLQFEAASVKLHTAASPSTGRSGIQESPGLIRIENLSLKAVIGIAFGVKEYQIEAPGWLGGVSVDIDAKPPAGYQRALLQPLLRNLLTNRFKLAVHHESKEVPGFALVAPKGGHKLHAATKPRGYLTGRPGLIEGTQVSMTQLVGVLARLLGRPVIDKTGLTEMYELKLEWMPDQPAAAPGADEPREASEPGPSLFSAVNEQLGLRLQTQRVAVDVVVVDHMERVPTEN
jgi:uncharacterized protein (TIGR03435 family)